MKKNIKKISHILITISVLAIIAIIIYLKPDSEKMIQFIANNPDRSSIILAVNDSIIIDSNRDKYVTLGSTVKLIIAIECAEQIAVAKISADELILISELEKFYVPGTDGGAHEKWLKRVVTKRADNQVKLIDVAKGMIEFSSNANTEWLLNKLGIQNVNSRLDSLGIKMHTPIFYPVSSLFVGIEAFPIIENDELAKRISDMKLDDYIYYTNNIHNLLLKDLNYKQKYIKLNASVQKSWSDKLPASTAGEYFSLLKKINNRFYFSDKTQSYLDTLLEFPMADADNHKKYKHYGMKGGSTICVSTKALYATDLNDRKTELVYMLNNLSFLEKLKLQLCKAGFEWKILNDRQFVDKIRKLNIVTT